MKRGRQRVVIWAEDDARPPDAETLEQAIVRIFGKKAGELIRQLPKVDLEDEFVSKFEVVVSLSWPGNSAIYYLQPEAEAEAEEEAAV